MKFINLKKGYKDKVIVSFNNEDCYLLDFIKVVVNNKNIHYDFSFNRWYFHINYLNTFKDKYSDLIAKEFGLPKIQIATAEKFPDIGKMMKLRPYEYQREAISFILNQNNALLTLPCGAGECFV